MLNVKGLRKEFASIVAVDGVSLEVQRGELFGLLGPNGAGKTTTIRTILNIIRPEVGDITFDGRPFSPEIWNTIGYLPEERGLYRKSKIVNTILYFASLKGVPAEVGRPRAMDWLDRFGLQDRAGSRIEELSKGNQQKVQLIIALLHKPELLILDEPFSGLDPVNQILLKDVLMDLRRQNVAIIFSTHQMEQVEKLCDNICLINKGRTVLQGALREIKKQYGKNSVHLEYEGDGSFLAGLPLVRRADVYEHYAELELANPEQSNALLNHLDGKLSLRKFEVVEPSLNSIFLDVVGGTPVGKKAQNDDGNTGGRKDHVGMDARVKKAAVSVGLTAVLAIVLTLSRLQDASPDWTVPGLLLVAVAVSVFNLMKVLRKIRQEQQSAGGGK